MGNSFTKKHSGKSAETPAAWTDQCKHKYCGKLDLGRKGKPNKAQRCDDCQAVKARLAKMSQRDMENRRMEKMGGLCWEEE